MPWHAPPLERLEQDVHLRTSGEVSWNRDSAAHPRNWPRRSKLYTTAVVVWLEFFMTLISSSGTAASKGAVARDFPMSTTLAYFAFLSIYLLGQSLGGIACAPISEVFGRRTIYIIASVVFAASSAVVAATPHVVGVYVGRFVQGVAAAIPATVAFGQFDDLFDADTRIWVVYWYTFFGFTGIALGPIYSTYVTLKLGWRWVFYIATIAAGVSSIACLFMKESNAKQLLAYRAKQLSKYTSRPLYAAGEENPQENEQKGSPIKNFFRTQIYLPALLITTEPLVMLCSLLCAIAFGLIYGLIEALTIIYTSGHFADTFSETTSCFAFIPILVGFFINVLPRIYDSHLLAKFRRQHRRIEPETKIRSFAIACPSLAMGLWIMAWTVPPMVTIPWPISMIGLICIGFAANDFSYVLFGYVTDAYGETAASAVGALSTARTLTAAAFPLFASQMYKGLGNNVASSLLAGVATVFCSSAWIFLKKGKQLRARSRWTAKGNACLQEENQHMQDDAGEKDTKGHMAKGSTCSDESWI